MYTRNLVKLNVEMVMRFLYRILIVIVIFSANGCSKDKDDYSIPQNYHSKPLIIPSDLAKNKIDDYYPIPDIGKASTKKVSLIPPGSKGIKE